MKLSRAIEPNWGGAQNIFFQAHNDELQTLYGLKGKFNVTELSKFLLELVKVAFLLADGRLLIPTIDLVQSQTLGQSINYLNPLLVAGDVVFCGSSLSPERFIKKKQRHFSKVRLYPAYFEMETEHLLEKVSRYWIRRIHSTSHDITKRWSQTILEIDQLREETADSLLFLSAYDRLENEISLKMFVDQLYRVPEILGRQAFMWDVVTEEALPQYASNPSVGYLMKLAINLQWLMSHLDEYEAILLIDFPSIGDMDCYVAYEKPEATVSFRIVMQILRFYRLAELIPSLTAEQLAEIKYSDGFSFFKQHILWPRYGRLQNKSVRPTLGVIKERRLLENLSKIAEGEGTSLSKFRDTLECIIIESYDSSLSGMNIFIHPQDPVQCFYNINIGGDVVNSEIKVDSTEVQTGDIIKSTGVLNFDSVLNRVTTTISELNETSINKTSKELAALCEQLVAAITEDEALDIGTKSEALELLEKVAEAGADLEDETLLMKARRALGSLKGLLEIFPKAVEAARVAKELMPLIVKALGLELDT